MPGVFISHAVADRQLADHVATALQALEPEIQTFVSSRPADIGADIEWLPAIEAALIRGDALAVNVDEQPGPAAAEAR